MTSEGLTSLGHLEPWHWPCWKKNNDSCLPWGRISACQFWEMIDNGNMFYVSWTPFRIWLTLCCNQEVYWENQLHCLDLSILLINLTGLIQHNLFCLVWTFHFCLPLLFKWSYMLELCINGPQSRHIVLIIFPMSQWWPVGWKELHLSQRLFYLGMLYLFIYQNCTLLPKARYSTSKKLCSMMWCLIFFFVMFFTG